VIAPCDPFSWATPRDADLGLQRIGAGLTASVLPNGSLFAIEHESRDARIMINQVLGSPLAGGIARVYVRVGGAQPRIDRVTGCGAGMRFGAAADRVVWEGGSAALSHRATLWLAPQSALWLWRIEVVNRGTTAVECDAMLIQDLGLGERGFLMNNEAYASQYIDHHVGPDPLCGPVIMSRQNLAQRGAHPWTLHGCLDGAAAFATDALQIFGPHFRDADAPALPFGKNLLNERLQHEVACIALQSHAAAIEPGSSALWTFFGCYEPDHRAASSDSDLARIGTARAAALRCEPRDIALAPAVASFVERAPALVSDPAGANALARGYPERSLWEEREGSPLSFFVPDGARNRHVVLAAKERIVARRHGALLRSGQSTLPDDSLLCATAWMHGVFAAQLTIGNTTLHKLFSVSRDPYNITRSSGLRILVDLGRGWTLLTVPTLFEIGLSDCRWVYRHAGQSIVVRAVAAGHEPAMQWEVTVEGPPCRFLVFAHLVLGEREFEHSGQVAIDGARKRLSFRPDPAWLWAQRYPHASYHLVTSTPEAIEAIGGDELLYADGAPRTGGYAVLRTRPTNVFRFAVTGCLADPAESERLAEKYERGVDLDTMLAPSAAFWEQITRGTRIRGAHPDATMLDTIFPWLAHDALIHLSVPRGLEQYTGAAWGTRDVCQGPIEFLLALEHDEPVRDILRIVFALQYEARGDWPQWFMLEPYSNIQDRHAHGDVIVWPLKALCDYVEASNDLGFLDEPVAWRHDEALARTEYRAAIADHVAKLIATAAARFVPGTRLMRYGEGDWNDSLQPADPGMREWLVSSWTAALFFQQLGRYAEVLRRAGRERESDPIRSLAAGIRDDFHRHLIRDGTVAGYALFAPAGGEPELLLHPSDRRTGLKYSLLPMTRSIIAGLFTPEQAEHHLRLIREHLAFPDGVRLIDRPVSYRGGPEQLFRRAESAAFFGREIGLMYVHAHLRYAEALAIGGDADGLWDALLTANPIAVTECVGNAALRQRNSYFSSSDARFADRYQASAEWQRVERGEIPVDGGWRVYSSGPGLYVNMLIRHALGRRRHFGERVTAPLLPRKAGDVMLAWAPPPAARPKRQDRA
jgi:cellobiose phosphorylase